MSKSMTFRAQTCQEEKPNFKNIVENSEGESPQWESQLYHLCVSRFGVSILISLNSHILGICHTLGTQ